MIDVPVAENTALDRNTEKYNGKINPFVVRRAPFRVYDPFIAVSSPVVADSSTLVLRLETPPRHRRSIWQGHYQEPSLSCEDRSSEQEHRSAGDVRQDRESCDRQAIEITRS
jgi:hypothetical protein